MSKQTHDPAPWFYQENSDAYTHIIRPLKNPGQIITHMSQDTSGKVEANARHIVNAVNCHDELVEVVNWIASFVLTAKDGGDAWCAVRNQPGANEWVAKMKSVTEKLTQK